MIFLLCLFMNVCDCQPDLSNIKYIWKSDPEIYVCENSNIDKSKILSSLSWWNDYGFDFGNIHFNYSCDIIDRGIYIFGQKKLREDESGLTKIRYYNIDNTLYMESASVFVDDEFIMSDYVIYHEIGHAFGLSHVNEPLDVMYHKPLFLNVTTDFKEE